MIKIIAKYNDTETDISFPCSEAHLSKKIKELTGSEDYPANMFVKEFVEPTQFNSLKDTFLNLDELNYLAKRMDSFFNHEEDAFFAAMEIENTREVKGLINLTFNLPHYTLIQELKDMEKIGRQHMINTGQVTSANEENMDYAKIGRELLASGKGIFTNNGLIFRNEEIPYLEYYDGQVFPEYSYKESYLLTVKISFGEKSEYLYFPEEENAITKAFNRLGASPDECAYSVEEFNMNDPKWEKRFSDLFETEGVFDINALAENLHDNDIDLNKLEALIHFADDHSAETMAKLAQREDAFRFLPGVTSDYELGQHLIDNYSEYEVPCEVYDFVDFDKFGEHMHEEFEGEFVDEGYVYIPDGRTLEAVMRKPLFLSMGGM